MDGRHDTAGDLAWAVVDAGDDGIRATRIDLDHLRADGDRYAVLAETAETPREGSNQEKTVDRGDRLSSRHVVADLVRGADGAGGWSVDIPVASMPGERSGFSRQRARGTMPDHLAEGLPARLNRDIDRLAGHKPRSEADRERRDSPARLGTRSLAHSGIDQHVGEDLGLQVGQIPDQQGDHGATVEEIDEGGESVHPARLDSIQAGVPIEDGVGEGHPAPGCGRLGVVEDHHPRPRAKELVSDGGADIATAFNGNAQPCQVATVQPLSTHERILGGGG